MRLHRKHSLDILRHHELTIKLYRLHTHPHSYSHPHSSAHTKQVSDLLVAARTENEAHSQRLLSATSQLDDLGHACRAYRRQVCAWLICSLYRSHGFHLCIRPPRTTILTRHITTYAIFSDRYLLQSVCLFLLSLSFTCSHSHAPASSLSPFFLHFSHILACSHRCCHSPLASQIASARDSIEDGSEWNDKAHENIQLASLRNAPLHQQLRHKMALREQVCVVVWLGCFI